MRHLPRPDDLQGELRQRLAARIACVGPGELANLAARIGLAPDALQAFLGRSHLAEWAASRLEPVLDAAERESGDGQ